MNEHFIKTNKNNLFIELKKGFADIFKTIDENYKNDILILQQTFFLRQPNSHNVPCQCAAVHFYNITGNPLPYSKYCDLSQEKSLISRTFENIIACEAHQQEIETSTKWLIIRKSDNVYCSHEWFTYNDEAIKPKLIFYRVFIL